MKRPGTKRSYTIAEAVLEKDALMTIQSLIDHNSSGNLWFRLMHAVILEVNFVGPGILLDRFTFSEVKIWRLNIHGLAQNYFLRLWAN